MPGFSHFFFLHHFVLAKLATSSIRVKNAMIPVERRIYNSTDIKEVPGATLINI